MTNARQASQTGDRPAGNGGSGQLPAHVAIIMDGNGRWASARHLPRIAGHRAGVDNVRRAINCLAGRGIKYVTLFAFSTENWDRPPEEVSFLTGALLRNALEAVTQELHENGVRILHMGRLDRLSVELQQKIREAIELTTRNTTLTLSVAFDYGGRADIVEAARRIVAAGIRAGDLDEDVFSRHLYCADVPDPDLIVRTGGDFRISNFMLWQSAYSEFYSTPVLWPDFDEQAIDQALEAYEQRTRRFGRVSDESG